VYDKESVGCAVAFTSFVSSVKLQMDPHLNAVCIQFVFVIGAACGPAVAALKAPANIHSLPLLLVKSDQSACKI
jgi:hypothetical protein